MQKNDKDLKSLTGVGQEEVTTLHVTDLLEELKEESSNKWAEVWQDAIKHERAYHGFTTEGDRDQDRAQHGKNHKNLFRILVSGYNAKITEGRTEHRAYPMHPTAADKKTAELANRYLDWWRRDQQFNVRDHEFSQNGQLHGTAFWKIYWDTQSGRPLKVPVFDSEGVPVIDELSGEQVERVEGYEGGVECDIVTVFDCCFGPGHRIEKAEWVLSRQFVSKQQALALLDQAGLDPEALGEPKDYMNASDGEAVGYEVWEIWYKPGFRFPKGLFAKVLGTGEVLFSGMFPYEHGELPFACWHPDFVRDRPFGTSSVFDNYQLQLKLNLAEAKKDELMNRMAGVLMTAPEDLKDEIEEGNLIIGVTDPNQANMIQFKSLNNIPSLITDRSREIQADMFDVGQQNEILTGFSDVKAGTSAKTYEFLAQGDQKKMAGSKIRHSAAEFRRDHQALRLFQQFAVIERQVLVIGEDQEPYLELFNGAALDGTDVVLEPVSGIDQMRSNKASSAPEAAQLGTLDPGAVMEVSKTGLDTTLDDQQGRSVVQQLLVQGLATGGEGIVPDATVAPLTALSEIQNFRALGQPGTNEAMLLRFEEFYRTMLQQATAPQNPGVPNG